MMTYRRVIPRDLFNEADLLKCYGRLWILLDENCGHSAEMTFDSEDPFHIEQNPADGSLSIANVSFIVKGQLYELTRPLNSRAPWPLYLQTDDEAIPVFNRIGQLTPEFEGFIE